MESFHEHFVIYVIEIVIVIFCKRVELFEGKVCKWGGGGGVGHGGVPKND